MVLTLTDQNWFWIIHANLGNGFKQLFVYRSLQKHTHKNSNTLQIWVLNVATMQLLYSTAYV